MSFVDDLIGRINDTERRLGRIERLDVNPPVTSVARYSGTPAAGLIAYWTGAGTIAAANGDAIYQAPSSGARLFRQDSIALSATTPSQTVTIDILNAATGLSYVTEFSIEYDHTATVAATLIASGFIQWAANTGTATLYSYDLTYSGGCVSSGSISAITGGVRITLVRNSNTGTLGGIATIRNVGDAPSGISYTVTVT